MDDYNPLNLVSEGNFCGPTYSDGKFQASTCGSLSSLSPFDKECKNHDCCLARAGDNIDYQNLCNWHFHQANINKGFKRHFAANTVYYGHQPYRTMSDKFNKLFPPSKRLRTESWPIDTPEGSNTNQYKTGYSSDYYNYEEPTSSYSYGPNLFTTPRKRTRASDVPPRPAKKSKSDRVPASMLKSVRFNLYPSFNQNASYVQNRRRWFSKLPRGTRRMIASRKRKQWRSKYTRKRSSKNRSLALRRLNFRKKIRNRAAGRITRALYYGLFYKKKYGNYFNKTHIRRNFNNWRRGHFNKSFRRDFSHLFY